MKKIILIWTIIIAYTQANCQSWNLSGNAGTNSSTNFIGTTDNVNFKIRTKNNVRITVTAGGKVGIGTTTPVFKLDVKSGSINTDSVYRIGGSTVLSVKGDFNLFTGFSSGNSNTTGAANVGSGFQSLYANTDGSFNTAIGYNAMQFNTHGYNNTATGTNALLSNTTASENTAIGNSALYAQSYSNGGTDWVSANVAVGSFALLSNQPTSTADGINNTAVGHSALRTNSTGSYNTAIGKNALTSNTTGSENTANGQDALYFNTTGYRNTANGAAALAFNTNGNSNIANGYQALYANTTASQNTAIGSYALFSQSFSNGGVAWDSKNTAVGFFALFSNNPTSNSSGKNNTAVGHSALYSNTTGTTNTAIGERALYNTTASANTALGYDAGSSFNNSGGNVFLGYSANASAAGFNNSIAIGFSASVNANNKVRIGNASVGVFETQTGVWQPSDARFKENVKEDVQGLDFIMKLHPVSYNFNRLAFAKHIKEKTEGREGELETLSAIRTVGFIAQDVEKIIEQTGFTSFDAVHAPTNETDNYSMGYAAFVVPLVKSVQELNQELKSEVGTLKSEIENLKSEIRNLRSGESASATGAPQSAILFQNSPNPFSGKTLVNYYIPPSAKRAEIKIYAADGKELNSYSISSNGPGQIEITTGMLTEGIYNYTLIIDGKPVLSRQMIFRN